MSARPRLRPGLPVVASGARGPVVLALVILLSVALVVTSVGPGVLGPRWGTTVFPAGPAAPPTPPVGGVAIARPSLSDPSARPLTIGPGWVNLTGQDPRHPAPRGYAMSVATDPADGVMVYFGGCLVTQCPSNQTWVFAHGLWKNVTNPSDAPPARDYASMDYDANVHSVLLFGGQGKAGVLNDTWLFRAGVWTNVSFVGGGPAPRFGASLAFDPAPEENGSVLFGGCVPGLFVPCLNDTWVWQSWAGWVPLTPSLPPPGLGYASMAYDPDTGKIVLFGGCGTLCLGVSGATWELYSGQWWAVYPPASPTAQAEGSMVYDPGLHALLMFGGFGSSFVWISDTSTYSNGVWQSVSSSLFPSGRGVAGLALDPTGTTPILVGGESNAGSENNTWAFEPRLSATAVPSAANAEAAQPTSVAVRVQGGTPPYSALVRFGDGSASLASGNGPTLTVTHSYGKAGTYGATANVTDSFGSVATAVAASVTVTTGPTVTARATPTSADVGVPVSFSGHGSVAGNPTITYAWQFGDSASGAGASATHPYRSAGSYLVNVTASDPSGANATASLEVAIAPLPTVSPSVSPATPASGSFAAFLGGESGGTAPFGYAWAFGDGSTSAVPSPVHDYAKPGTYTVGLWVNDSGGGSVHRAMTVTIGPAAASASSGSSSGPPLWFWAALAAIVAVGVVGTVVLARRGRGSPPKS